MKKCCLVIVEDKVNNKLLMVHNNRGINKGLYNFPGGKIEKDETVEDGTIRENIEETGIIPLEIKTKGRIEFQPINMMVYIYYTDKFKGDIKFNKDENTAFWVEKDKIPYDKMRSSDRLWISEIFSDKYINKKIIFNNDFSVKSIENIYDNIVKYKNRYRKLLQSKTNKYLHHKDYGR